MNKDYISRKYPCDKKYIEYALDVVSGKKKSCKLVFLSCQRMLDLFDKEDIEFRQESAQEVENFINHLKHTQQPYTGKAFLLLDFLKFIIYNLYGWYKKQENGEWLRLYNLAYIQVPRFSGKTLLCSAIALYELCNCKGGEIYIAAPTIKQANISYSSVCNFIDNGLNKSNIFRYTLKRIECIPRKSNLTVFSPDAKHGDGFHPNFFLADETEIFPNADIFNLLLSGTAGRKSWLGIMIGTAGFNLTSFGKEQRDYSEKLLKGEIEDETFFPLVYELDDPEKQWDNPDSWETCSPSIGHVVQKKNILQALQQAKNQGSSAIVNFQTKTLNRWCQSAEQFIPDEYIFSSMEKQFNFFDIAKDKEVYIGVDLSATTDFTALSAMVVDDTDISSPKFYFKNITYLPDESLKSTYSNSKMVIYAKNGYVKLIKDSNVQDYSLVCDDICDIDNKCNHNLVSVSYDPWGSLQWYQILVDKLGTDSIMNPFSQRVGNFNSPTKMFEMSFLKHNMFIENNPLIKEQIRNIEIYSDSNGNIKPIKKVTKKKIDNVITMVMCIGSYLFRNNLIQGDLTTL